MEYFVVRSFDNAGYYETRLILLAAAIAVTVYFVVWQKDRRYLTAFLSGVISQGLLELTLKLLGLRGANYSLSVFGWTLPGSINWLYQGLVEGAILSVMAFWFYDFATRRDKEGAKLPFYLAMCVLIVALAAYVGTIAAGLPFTSLRPMFAPVALILTTFWLLLSIGLCWWKGGRRGIYYLFLFAVGLTIYAVLTFETLHVTGARYIALKQPDESFAAASAVPQIGLMLWSHIWDIAISKMNYFAIPFALGLLPPKNELTADEHR